MNIHRTDSPGHGCLHIVPQRSSGCAESEQIPTGIVVEFAVGEPDDDAGHVFRRIVRLGQMIQRRDMEPGVFSDSCPDLAIGSDITNLKLWIGLRLMKQGDLVSPAWLKSLDRRASLGCLPLQKLPVVEDVVALKRLRPVVVGPASVEQFTNREMLGDLCDSRYLPAASG